MSIWAIGDLHLSFGVPNKRMDVFGENWANHVERTLDNWTKKVNKEDLVLIPGDISWAKHTEDAIPDLEWIDKLPGTKVMLRGNHDYWWSSKSKVKKILPDSIHIIHNDSFEWNEFIIAGSRLWDTPEYNFNNVIPYLENPCSSKEAAAVPKPEEAEPIFIRELGRLEMSLKSMGDTSKTRIAMTHYPPIHTSLESSRVSALLEKYDIKTCVFGHLHNADQKIPLFGEKRGIRYILVAGDYIHFDPVQIY